MTAEQLRAARAMLRWEQKEAAERSGVSASTIKRLETLSGSLGANTSTIAALQRAFESAGVVFLEASDGMGQGVRLAKPV